MAPRAALVSIPATPRVPAIAIGPAASLAELVRTEVRRAARGAAADGRPFRLAVSGGAVATTILPALAANDATWARSEIWWVDERVVPIESRESNAGEAARGWLRSSGAAAGHVHSMAGASDAPDDSARQHDAALRAALGHGGVIDLAILGVGEDGHVCSLFPGRAAIEEQQAWVTCEHQSPKPPPVRLTWTLAVFGRVARVCVVALGDGKRGAMGRVREELEKNQPTLPLARLFRTAPASLWLLDVGAAAELGDVSVTAA